MRERVGVARSLVATRAVAVVLGVILTAGFAGTIAYALKITDPNIGKVVHACYDKGGKKAGKIRLVNEDTECKKTEAALSWTILNQITDFNGTPCEVNGTPGVIDISFGGGGVGSWVCIVPGSSELCDGIDNDQDGDIDEDFPNLGSACSNGLGQCSRTGVFVCTSDGTGTECDATPGAPNPEICDGLDNDCDGQTDEGGDAACDDGDECTANACTGGGCVSQPVANGTTCQGGTGSCSSGVCQPIP